MAPEPSGDANLSAYAAWWIRQRITKAIVEAA